MSLDQDIVANFATVRAQIAADCALSRRETKAVSLLAVSKSRPAAAVRAAYGLGQRMFGENRVQELVRKASELTHLSDLQWHLIGSLQTNKVSELLQVRGLALLHSLDRERLAIELQRALRACERTLDVLLQVNATGEETKHGCQPENASGLLDFVARECPDVRVVGLMAMGPLQGDPAPVFRRVASLRDDLRRRTGLPLDVLSLGMSGDLAAAIDAGSTLVRIGTALFGASR